MGRPAAISLDALARLARDLRLTPAKGKQRLVERALATAGALLADDAPIVAVPHLLKAITGTEARDYGSGSVPARAALCAVLAFVLRASAGAAAPVLDSDRSEEDAAQFCGVTRRTVRRWRREWLPSVWRSIGGRQELRIPKIGWDELESHVLLVGGRSGRRAISPRVGTLERAHLRESAAHLHSAGVTLRMIVPALARHSPRSRDAIRRALGRQVHHRAVGAVRRIAWRMWLRGIDQTRIAGRLGIPVRRVGTMVRRARAEWLLASIPATLVAASPATEETLSRWRAAPRLGSQLPRWPWGAPSSMHPAAAARKVERDSGVRLDAARALLGNARVMAGTSAESLRIDAAETLVRWATLILRSLANEIALDLLRRARRELGQLPEALPRALRERLWKSAREATVGAILRELVTPTGIPARRAAPLAFSRVLTPIRDQVRGFARLSAAPPEGDWFAEAWPWDLRLDSRGLRVLHRLESIAPAASTDTARARLAARLGLRGVAPVSALELAGGIPAKAGAVLRAWERLCVSGPGAIKKRR
ncbi:MAG: helix-turn-helix domain-containing protein [Planctomycetota bacterium]|nr:helix-turn-helix domain-containing protein [Planctomycetota bacterium]